MRNAILMHGWADKNEFMDRRYPTASNSHWFPWLTKELMIKGIHTDAPEVPDGYNLNYGIWKKAFERFEVTKQTILVGHSCGAGFLLRWLSETGRRVDKLIFVAPWTGVEFGVDFDKSFFEFIPQDVSVQANDMVIIHSADDNDAVAESVRQLKSLLTDFRYVEFSNKGHFTRSSLGSEEFPELLKEIQK